MQYAGKDEPDLQGTHVLVVEDDLLISMELTSVLTAAGADVIGPSHTVADALALVDREDISVAILDVRLGDDTVAPVARGLSRRKIPFVFYTGQGTGDPIWREWPASKVIPKPSLPRSLVAAVADAVNRPAPFRKS
jgi:DNA-binding response OmpR family regulator